MKTYKDHKKRHYLFDWDNNILHMDTPIKLNQLSNGEWKTIHLKSDEYRDIKSKIGVDYFYQNDSFEGFIRDEDFYLYSDISMFYGNIGPSFNKFKECLMYGNDFAIITARGHSYYAFKRVIKWMIDKMFSINDQKFMINSLDKEPIESYLDRQEYYAVGGGEFRKKFHLRNTDIDIAIYKKIAVEDYVKNVVNRSKSLIESEIIKTISIGFSDDDIINIEKIESLIKDSLRNNYPEVTFVIYHTSDHSVDKRVFM